MSEVIDGSGSGCGYSWDHTVRETYNEPDGRAWECTECGADGWEPATEGFVYRGGVDEKALQRFVGYGPAAEHLGLKPKTLSSYVARGQGPQPLAERQARGQYNLPVFTREELDRWAANRPGQGARTDLVTKTGDA